jgi:large subunit ribosomal protein L16
MLSPKRTKFRKMQRGRLKGKASRNNKLDHGTHKKRMTFGAMP